MERAIGNPNPDGALRAIAVVLRAVLDAQPEQDRAWEHLGTQYQRALAQIDADPSLAGERAAFEKVFALMDTQLPESSHVIKELRRAGHLSDSAAAEATDGVDDTSLY